MAILSASALVACGSRSGEAKPAATEAPAAEVPSVAFNADSAYAYVARQTEFGPRVPGTDAWRECGAWLAGKLKEAGVENVTVQRGEASTCDGTSIPLMNISGQIRPDAARRVLLLAHWDSRPWADHDGDSANRRKAIDGANDGASGVGVILEIARALKGQAGNLGVDILFVDGEDYGPHADSGKDGDDCWALGSQYWLAEPTLDLGAVRAAILLDMVGARDARFHREYFSNLYARDVVDKVWKAAKAAGHGDRFDAAVGGAITDDHVYFLREGVAAIDIIESANPATGSFNPTWHTLDDNISNIDRATLGAVGETVMRALRDF